MPTKEREVSRFGVSNDVATLGRLCKKLNSVERKLRETQRENRLLRRELQTKEAEEKLQSLPGELMPIIKPVTVEKAPEADNSTADELVQQLAAMKAKMEDLQLHNSEQEGKIQALES